jgi:predicted Rossmann fold nucleotide-binding protein DprA/Smf involved in DNA uptake
MNAILNQQDEAQWALIAQILKPCTPRLQPALIEQLGSFSQIFESQQSINNPALNQQLQVVRRAYHAGQWQDDVESINNTLEQFQAKIIPITREDYPPSVIISISIVRFTILCLPFSKFVTL